MDLAMPFSFWVELAEFWLSQVYWVDPSVVELVILSF